MAKGTVNRVTIIGRLGHNPELKYMPSGMAMINIQLATNDGYKDAKTGQFIDTTEWHRVALFGKQAETLQQFVRKGDLIFIEGKLKTRKWQDKQTGQDRYATDIVATDMQMLGSANHNAAPMPDYVPSHIQVPSDQVEQAQSGASHQTSTPSMEEIEQAEDTPPF